MEIGDDQSENNFQSLAPARLILLESSNGRRSYWPEEIYLSQKKVKFFETFFGKPEL